MLCSGGLHKISLEFVFNLFALSIVYVWHLKGEANTYWHAIQYRYRYVYVMVISPNHTTKKTPDMY